MEELEAAALKEKEKKNLTIGPFHYPAHVKAVRGDCAKCKEAMTAKQGQAWDADPSVQAAQIPKAMRSPSFPSWYP